MSVATELAALLGYNLNLTQAHLDSLTDTQLIQLKNIVGTFHEKGLKPGTELRYFIICYQYIKPDGFPGMDTFICYGATFPTPNDLYGFASERGLGSFVGVTGITEVTEPESRLWTGRPHRLRSMPVPEPVNITVDIKHEPSSDAFGTALADEFKKRREVHNYPRTPGDNPVA